MIARFTVTFCLMLFCFFAKAQRTNDQYFDDMVHYPYSSIVLIKDTGKNNIWQIGKPSKSIFYKAATFPNAVLTDTVNTYPVNNFSSFQFPLTSAWRYGIQAIQWKQKIDMDKKKDGGIVEVSLDGGQNWANVYHNPYVYKYYGFDSSNLDTLKGGAVAFSGTDTSWKDIWLCFDASLMYKDSIVIRYSFKSDSIDNKKDGWMIDNIISHITILHTAIPENEDQKEYLRVYPQVTNGQVNIEAQKLMEFHIIENMQLIDVSGKIVQKWGIAPTKFFINIENHPSGIYFLQVTTNKKSETFNLFLSK